MALVIRFTAIYRTALKKMKKMYGQVTSLRPGCVEISVKFKSVQTCLSYIEDVIEGKIDTIFEPLRDEIEIDNIELKVIMTQTQFDECMASLVDSMQNALLDSLRHTVTDLNVASTFKPKTTTSNVEPCELQTNKRDVKKIDCFKPSVEEVQHTFGELLSIAESTETRHENWLRVVWGLLYVREGLQGFVDTKGKQQYQTFLNNVNAKCNNQTCDQCQINSKCPNGKTKVTGKSKFRPAHFCDEMYKEIQNTHSRNNPFWMNTDSTKWQDPNIGYWEVAKCYLSLAGYFDKTGPDQVDASGLLSICINSLFIKQHITTIQHFEEVRTIRNKTLHDAHYELDGQTADDCLDKMNTVLEDPHELIHDTFAKQAAVQIRKIKDKTAKPPDIIHNKSLEEIEGLIYDTLHRELKELVVDEVERKVKRKDKQVMQNYSNERDNNEREERVKDLQQQLAKFYRTQINSAPISPLLPDKDERLDKFYVPPKIVETDPRKVGAAEKDTGAPVTSYRQLFCKTGELRKNVFMVGEAGMGKSSFAAMCALKWANQLSSTAMIKQPDENGSPQKSLETLETELKYCSNAIKHILLPVTKLDEHFQDDTFFKEIEFVFYLTLRDSCDRCDLTDMIRDQLINRLYQHGEMASASSTLKSVMSSKRFVIIADGLDEWTHPNISCLCKEEDKVIPYLAPTIDATVLITSRPWRMSQKRVRDTIINMYLEIEGTAEMGLLIQKVLTSLNETVTEKKTLPDFVKFVERMKLERLLSVPIIVMLLVCLSFEGIHESFSLCDIYAHTIEMMIGRKNIPVPIDLQKNISVLRCFKHTEKVQKYYSIVMKMAELAFTTLFSNDQTSTLVFKKVDNMEDENLLFVLKSGILQESKAASLIRKSSSYSFIHKTVQEFLAAVYLSGHPEIFQSKIIPFFEKNCGIMDFSQVFTFMCGLNIELANDFSAVISNKIPSYFGEFSMGANFGLIQSMIVSGYKEAKASEVSNIQLSLFSFGHSKSADDEVINDLLSINKSRVRYINTSFLKNQAKLQEVFSSSTDTLNTVYILGQAGQYDLSACNRLENLTISGSETTNIFVNTKNLVNLDLKRVSKNVEYSILKSLQRETDTLKILFIESITNIRFFCETLPRLTHLENVHIMKTDLGDHALLLPSSAFFVQLRMVKLKAQALMGLVERQKENMYSVEFQLSECIVEPNTEYEEIKRYISTLKHFECSDSDMCFSFRRSRWITVHK